MKTYLIFIFSLFIATTVMAQNDTVQKVISGRKNDASQENKPYVIMISSDGFRYDYADKYHAVHLLEYQLASATLALLLINNTLM